VVYTGANTYLDRIGKTNGSYTYKVKAIKSGYTDSALSAAATTTVTATCGTPSGPYAPATSTTGSYRVSWGSKTAGSTFILYENDIVVYTGANTYLDRIGKTNGTYSYKVKAIKSGYVDSALTPVVTTTVAR